METAIEVSIRASNEQPQARSLHSPSHRLPPRIPSTTRISDIPKSDSTAMMKVQSLSNKTPRQEGLPRKNSLGMFQGKKTAITPKPLTPSLSPMAIRKCKSSNIDERYRNRRTPRKRAVPPSPFTLTSPPSFANTKPRARQSSPKPPIVPALSIQKSQSNSLDEKEKDSQLSPAGSVSLASPTESYTSSKSRHRLHNPFRRRRRASMGPSSSSSSTPSSLSSNKKDEADYSVVYYPNSTPNSIGTAPIAGSQSFAHENTSFKHEEQDQSTTMECNEKPSVQEDDSPLQEIESVSSRHEGSSYSSTEGESAFLLTEPSSYINDPTLLCLSSTSWGEESNMLLPGHGSVKLKISSSYAVEEEDTQEIVSVSSSSGSRFDDENQLYSKEAAQMQEKETFVTTVSGSSSTSFPKNDVDVPIPLSGTPRRSVCSEREKQSDTPRQTRDSAIAEDTNLARKPSLRDKIHKLTKSRKVKDPVVVYDAIEAPSIRLTKSASEVGRGKCLSNVAGQRSRTASLIPCNANDTHDLKTARSVRIDSDSRKGFLSRTLSWNNGASHAHTKYDGAKGNGTEKDCVEKQGKAENHKNKKDEGGPTKNQDSVRLIRSDSDTGKGLIYLSSSLNNGTGQADSKQGLRYQGAIGNESNEDREVVHKSGKAENHTNETDEGTSVIKSMASLTALGEIVSRSFDFSWIDKSSETDFKNANHNSQTNQTMGATDHNANSMDMCSTISPNNLTDQSPDNLTKKKVEDTLNSRDSTCLTLAIDASEIISPDGRPNSPIESPDSAVSIQVSEAYFKSSENKIWLAIDPSQFVVGNATDENASKIWVSVAATSKNTTGAPQTATPKVMIQRQTLTTVTSNNVNDDASKSDPPNTSKHCSSTDVETLISDPEPSQGVSKLLSQASNDMTSMISDELVQTFFGSGLTPTSDILRMVKKSYSEMSENSRDDPETFGNSRTIKKSDSELAAANDFDAALNKSRIDGNTVPSQKEDPLAAEGLVGAFAQDLLRTLGSKLEYQVESNATGNPKINGTTTVGDALRKLKFDVRNELSVDETIVEVLERRRKTIDSVQFDQLKPAILQITQHMLDRRPAFQRFHLVGEDIADRVENALNGNHPLRCPNEHSGCDCVVCRSHKLLEIDLQTLEREMTAAITEAMKLPILLLKERQRNSPTQSVDDDGLVDETPSAKMSALFDYVDAQVNPAKNQSAINEVFLVRNRSASQMAVLEEEDDEEVEELVASIESATSNASSRTSERPPLLTRKGLGSARSTIYGSQVFRDQKPKAPKRQLIISNSFSSTAGTHSTKSQRSICSEDIKKSKAPTQKASNSRKNRYQPKTFRRPSLREVTKKCKIPTQKASNLTKGRCQSKIFRPPSCQEGIKKNKTQKIRCQAKSVHPPSLQLSPVVFAFDYSSPQSSGSPAEQKGLQLTPIRSPLDTVFGMVSFFMEFPERDKGARTRSGRPPRPKTADSDKPGPYSLGVNSLLEDFVGSPSSIVLDNGNDDDDDDDDIFSSDDDNDDESHALLTEADDCDGESSVFEIFPDSCMNKYNLKSGKRVSKTKGWR